MVLGILAECCTLTAPLTTPVHDTSAKHVYSPTLLDSLGWPSQTLCHALLPSVTSGSLWKTMRRWEAEEIDFSLENTSPWLGCPAVAVCLVMSPLIHFLFETRFFSLVAVRAIKSSFGNGLG